MLLDSFQRTELRRLSLVGSNDIAAEATFVHSIFGGFLRNQLNAFEAFLDLSVELHMHSSTLQQLLGRFTTSEYLGLFQCDGCHDFTCVRKQLTVEKAPNVLTIQLKRFSRHGTKNNQQISFPCTLDLGPYMSGAADAAAAGKHHPAAPLACFCACGV